MSIYAAVKHRYFREIKTIGSCFRKRQDNFVLLRVFAASAVIYGHSFALSSVRGYKDFVHQYIGQTHIAHEAVSIFFVISGFLVTASYLNRNDWRVFAKSRLLRIVPALLVCLLLTVFILGPALTTVSLVDYFSSLKTYTYLLWNISFIKPDFFLPGVFENNRIGGINGSLWTLPAEMRMYFIVFVFGLVGLLGKRMLFNGAIALLFIIGFLYPDIIPLINHNPKYVRLAAMFAIGAAMYINRDVIPLHGSIVIALLGVTIFFHKTDYFIIALSVFLAYATIWLAYVPSIPWTDRLQDNSYGIYIYAFPVQQTLVDVFPNIGPYMLFVFAFPITYMLAMLSWAYVEKPMLGLKGARWSEWWPGQVINGQNGIVPRPMKRARKDK